LMVTLAEVMIRPVSLILAVCLLAGLVGCNRDPKEASKKYVNVGNRYFEQGKYKEAVLMYKRAIQKHMKNGEAYYRLGLTDLKLQLPVEAVRAFQRAVSLQPDNADAMAKLADIFLSAYAALPSHPKEYLTEADLLITRLQKLDVFQFRRLSGYRKLLSDDTTGALVDFRAAHGLRPDDASLGLIMFQTLVKLDQFDEAVRLAQQVIDGHKQFAPIYGQLYLEYLRRKDLAGAERILKLRATNNPSDADALVALAGHYFGSSKRPEMLSALNQILSERKKFPQANMQVGDFYFRIREFDQAIRLYDEGIRNDSANKTDYQKRMIEALMFQGKRVEAAQLVDTLLKSKPGDLDARAMRASLILQGGKREELQGAINELQSIVTKMPNNAVVRYNLGRALLAKQELEAARLQFLEAIKIYPAYLPPRIALAQLYLFKGEFAAAMQSADEVLQFDRDNMTAKLVRTSGLIGSGQSKLARAELEKVVAANADSRDAIFQLAMLDLGDKNTKGAESGFSRLSKMTPPDLRGQLGLAQVEIAKGSLDNALKILADQLQKDPNRNELRLAYANTAVEAKRYDIAVTEFKRLIEAQPKSTDLYMRLGQTLRRMQSYDEAGKVFEQARTFNPNDARPLLELALISEEAGRPDDARPL
ncbi:MAG: tetratricopeptide repeat protein, partial [Acidobacteria bacterium]|nr:tetratricopeptide repeat protein [Acidobacteriota bacterium]